MTRVPENYGYMPRQRIWAGHHCGEDGDHDRNWLDAGLAQSCLTDRELFIVGDSVHENLYKELVLFLSNATRNRIHFARLDRLDGGTFDHRNLTVHIDPAFRIDKKLSTLRYAHANPASVLLLNSGAHEVNTHSRPDGTDKSTKALKAQERAAFMRACGPDPPELQNPYLVHVLRDGFDKLYFNHSAAGTTDLAATAALALRDHEQRSASHARANPALNARCHASNVATLAAWRARLLNALGAIYRSGFRGRVAWRTVGWNFGFAERGDELTITRRMNAWARAKLPSLGVTVIDIEEMTRQRPEAFVHMYTHHFYCSDARGQHAGNLCQRQRIYFFRNGEPNLEYARMVMGFLCIGARLDLLKIHALR